MTTTQRTARYPRLDTRIEADALKALTHFLKVSRLPKKFVVSEAIRTALPILAERYKVTLS